ncbi:MAG: nucleotidyltransferase domain-containing protein [Paludibacteraceae bacterium]|nr:nucleotidyltransferase domain-containing protein [Paludibacteraceae bacterium]
MDKAEALNIVRKYKEVISPRFDGKARVYMFGSYSKGLQKPESDIDVAVVVPSVGDNWLNITRGLWRDVDKVSFLIEPVLLEDCRQSPLYDDVMRTGIAV